jgi:ABC-type uncharacterized transport system substrate-binding protein
LWYGATSGLGEVVNIANAGGRLPCTGRRMAAIAAIAAELVRRKVDVIFAHTTPPVLVAKQATSIVPIVFVAGDPVGTGVVSLATG